MLLQSSLTVVTPATSRLLLSVDEARAEIDFDATDSDPVIEGWIAAASSRIETYLRRVLAQETLAETFYLSTIARNRRRTTFLRLARRPIIGTPTLTLDDDVLTAADFLLIENTGVLFAMDDGQQSLWSGETLVVEYTAGYASTSDIPGEITRACMDLVRLTKASTTRDAALRSLEIPGVATETYQTTMVGDTGDLPPQIEDAIARHRSVRI